MLHERVYTADCGAQLSLRVLPSCCIFPIRLARHFTSVTLMAHAWSYSMIRLAR
jgi:hypothetical protein